MLFSEAKAATQAGVDTIISVRPGNAPLSDEDKDTYKTIESFDEIFEVLVSTRLKFETHDTPAPALFQENFKFPDEVFRFLFNFNVLSFDYSYSYSSYPIYRFKD